MALSTMEENIMELAGRGGQSAYPYYQAANVRKLASRKYKEEKEENVRRWQSEFDRRTTLDKLNEELSRANLALNQASSGRADVGAEMGRIGSFYPAATTEARRGTREELIGRDLIPESLLNEAMFDPRRDTSRDPYPAAQANLYGAARRTSGISTPATSRIVNAPPGYTGAGSANIAAFMQLEQLKNLTNRGSGPSNEFFRQQKNAAATRAPLSFASPGVPSRSPETPRSPFYSTADAERDYALEQDRKRQDLLRRSYEAGGKTFLLIYRG